MKIFPIYFVFLLIIFSDNFFVVGNGNFDYTTEANRIEPAGEIAWTPSYQNVKEIEERGITDKINYAYASDATCGIRDENGNYKRPEMKMFDYDEDDNDEGCLQNFHHKRFGPICGDPQYPKIKYCIMVKFFHNNKEPVLKEGEKDFLLVLIEGCAVCNAIAAGPNVEMELSLKWTWPTGSFFTGCREKTMETLKINGYKFRVENNKRMFPKFKDYSDKGLHGSFVLPGIFYQRICMGIFSADDMFNSFNDIKLVVKHNCGGNENSFEVDLPELVTKDYELNIAEMRGLLLDLDAQKALLYNFYDGKESDPSNDYIKTLKWGNWDAFGRIESPKKEAANN